MTCTSPTLLLLVRLRASIRYLPTYAPECNPVERVWWRLHEAVTRNPRYATMEELLQLTLRGSAAARISLSGVLCTTLKNDPNTGFAWSYLG
jgi:transposase